MRSFIDLYFPPGAVVPWLSLATVAVALTADWRGDGGAAPGGRVVVQPGDQGQVVRLDADRVDEVVRGRRRRAAGAAWCWSLGVEVEGADLAMGEFTR
jgi:hypothetical protein